MIANMSGEQRSRVCIFLLLFQLNSATSDNALNEFITCEGRCGEFIGFWCSCQSTCVVYRNCCENMTTYCPQTVADGHLRFGHLLQSDVMCHEMETFVISSCPRQFTKDSTLTTTDAMVSTLQKTAQDIAERRHDANRETQQEQFNSTLPVSMLALDTLKESESTLSSQIDTNTLFSDTLAVIVDMLYNNVVVTDMSTNLSYLNKDIFLCNGGNLSNSISWEVVISTQIWDATANPFSYYPPKYLWETMPGCTDMIEPVTCAGTGQADLEELCQSFTSYVMTIHIFRNRFCFLCSSYTLNDSPYYYEQRIKSHQSLASVSISLRNHSIDLILKNDDLESNLFPSWKILACTLNNIDQGEDVGQEVKIVMDRAFQTVVKLLSRLSVKNIQCQIIQCNDKVDLSLRPDGHCKMRKNVYLEYPISSFPLSETQLSVLPQFVNCSFQNYIGIEVLDVHEPASIFYDIDKEETVFIVNISSYISPEEWEAREEPYLSKHIIVNKGLKMQLMEQDKNGPNVQQQSRSDVKCIKSMDFALLPSDLIQNNVLNNTSSIQFCFQVDSNIIHYHSLCEIMFVCFYDFMHESDLVKIEEFSKLDCLSILTSHNSQVSIDIGIVSALTICFVTLIITT